tara:strand:- start:150 stop:347 length:198 start_codon:yes stop_codon:yes gene_type:complete
VYTKNKSDKGAKRHWSLELMPNEFEKFENWIKLAQKIFLLNVKSNFGLAKIKPTDFCGSGRLILS